MESILGYLKRMLREAGSARWEAIAHAAGVAKTLPRKLAYDTARDNPGVQTVQPLLDFFHEVEAGTRLLPDPLPGQKAPSEIPAAREGQEREAA